MIRVQHHFELISLPLHTEQSLRSISNKFGNLSSFSIFPNNWLFIFSVFHCCFDKIRDHASNNGSGRVCSFYQHLTFFSTAPPHASHYANVSSKSINRNLIEFVAIAIRIDSKRLIYSQISGLHVCVRSKIPLRF